MNEVRCCVTRWRKFPWLLPIELVLREISIYLHKIIGFKFIYFKKKGFYGK
ncbi:MAG: hypothetical protein PHV17_08940 [Candidatus Omnitrophica bacterium]|nr:hypothetical protein [Candidatus Omnitrophota bacterium]